MKQENKTSDKQAPVINFLSDVSITRFVDQSKFELIGYEAYYADGSKNYYKELSEVANKITSNPLVDLKQVGKRY